MACWYIHIGARSMAFSMWLGVVMVVVVVCYLSATVASASVFASCGDVIFSTKRDMRRERSAVVYCLSASHTRASVRCLCFLVRCDSRAGAMSSLYISRIWRFTRLRCTARLKWRFDTLKSTCSGGVLSVASSTSLTMALTGYAVMFLVSFPLKSFSMRILLFSRGDSVLVFLVT